MRAGTTSLRSATSRESLLISSLATRHAPLPIHTHLHAPCRSRRSREAGRRPPKGRKASAPLSSTTTCIVSPSQPPWASQRPALSVAISPVVYNIRCSMPHSGTWPDPHHQANDACAQHGDPGGFLPVALPPTRRLHRQHMDGAFEFQYAIPLATSRH